MPPSRALISSLFVAERKTFWKTSSPPVFGANRTDSSKLSTPQPQRAGFFVFSGARFLGRFWRESRLFVTTPVFPLPQVIFDFFYPYFGIRSSTVIAMENGINNPFVGSMWFLKTEELIFRQSIGIRAIWYCFPRQRVFAFTKNKIKKIKKIPPCLANT